MPPVQGGPEAEESRQAGAYLALVEAAASKGPGTFVGSSALVAAPGAYIFHSY